MIRNEIDNLQFGLLLLSKMRGYYFKSLTDFNYYKKNKYDPIKIKEILNHTIKMLAL